MTLCDFTMFMHAYSCPVLPCSVNIRCIHHVNDMCGHAVEEKLRND